MKRFSIFKSKRGLAIENAILFMLVIFSLCALLMSLSLLGHYQAKIEQNALLRRVQIDQIGEDYIAALSAQTSFAATYADYDYTVSGNALTVWYKEDETRTAVLYIEAERTAQEVRIDVWRYTPPT